MTDRYLRRTEIERSTGLSRTSIYRRIHEGTFPEPYNLGGNCIRWREQDLIDWKSPHERAQAAHSNWAGGLGQSLACGCCKFATYNSRPLPNPAHPIH